MSLVTQSQGGSSATTRAPLRARPLFHDCGVLTSVRGQVDDRECWRIDLDKLAHADLSLDPQDAVSARIAALSLAERELLTRAAAMGSVFWTGGLLVLQRMGTPSPPTRTPREEGDRRDVAEISALLESLVARGYVFPTPCSTFPGDDEYVFKHNLERESLQGMIPPPIAKRYHQAIADWLEFRTGVRSHEEHVARLAWHRERAGNRGAAALTWIEAGDIARGRYASVKAAEYYARGLELLGDGDARVTLSALHNHGDVLCLLGRYEEAIGQFSSMQALAYNLDIASKEGVAHNRIGRIYRDSGNLAWAAQHLHAGLALFRKAGDTRGEASSLDDLGKLAWMLGDYMNALQQMRMAFAMRKQLGDRRSIALSFNNLGLVLQDSGHFKEALEAFEKSLTIRREIGDQVGVLTTLNNLGTVAQDQRDDARAMPFFQEALTLARETGDRHKTVRIMTNVGASLYRLGHIVRAIDLLTESEKAAEQMGDRLLLAEALRGLGKAMLLRGDVKQAFAYTTRALRLFEAVQSKVHVGIALRTLGEVSAAGGGVDSCQERAGEYLLRSIAMFEEIGNDVEFARSCQSYARFLTESKRAAVSKESAIAAAQFSRKAEDIFAKLKISAVGIDPNAFFS